MKKVSINTDWSFSKGIDSGFFSAIMGGTTEKKQVNLPHDAMVETERKADAASGGGAGYFALSDYTYGKNFFVEDPTQIHLLEFEGAYHNAMVYLNGSYLGQHAYGYGNFVLDATRHICSGQNHLKVILRNTNPSGRWYNGGGLYRDVNLYTSGRDYIDYDGVELKTLDADTEMAVLQATIRLKHRSVETKKVTVSTRLLAGDAVAAEACSTLHLIEGEHPQVRQRLDVANPALWDAEHPHLYTWIVTFRDGEDVLDTAEGTFGIRTLQLDARRGLRVNGKTVKLRGGCIHHDSGILGSATFDDAEERRIRLLKEAGYNAIRCAHNPAAKNLLRACDKLGMYVMDEITDVWTTTKAHYDYGTTFAEHWEEDVTYMVRKDINHPSVILYSIGNEIPEAGDAIDSHWGKLLADKIHSLDDSRFTLNSLNIMLVALDALQRKQTAEQSKGGINETMNNLGAAMSRIMTDPIMDTVMDVAFDQTDLVGLNYAASRYELEARNHPQRILVGSETNPRDLAANWALVEKLPTVIGDFCWTAADYLGEVGIARVDYGELDRNTYSFYAKYPWIAAHCCDIDFVGDRTPISYWRECIWQLTQTPAITVQNPAHFGEKQNLTSWSWKSDATLNWTWPGFEGKPAHVEVMANADEVELFLNGTSLGRQSANETDRCYTLYEVVYQPGELKAVAYQNGEPVGTCILQSAGDMAGIMLECDRSSIASGARNLAYITITAVDAHGIRCTTASQEVQVIVEGAGTLQALGSADPKTEDAYHTGICHLYQGRALAILRSGVTPGDIKVTVTAEGYPPQTWVTPVQ